MDSNIEILKKTAVLRNITVHVVRTQHVFACFLSRLLPFAVRLFDLYRLYLTTCTSPEMADKPDLFQKPGTKSHIWNYFGVEKPNNGEPINETVCRT